MKIKVQYGVMKDGKWGVSGCKGTKVDDDREDCRNLCGYPEEVDMQYHTIEVDVPEWEEHSKTLKGKVVK